MSQWLLQEITARLVSTTARAELLRHQLADAEDDLERLRAAEQVVKEILATGDDELGHNATPGTSGLPDGEEELSGHEEEVTPTCQVALPARRVAGPSPAGLLIPYRHQAADSHELPPDYQALLAAVGAADSPVICKAICERLGLSLTSGQVEGVRAKLNRPADRGWLRKTPSGAFTPAP